MSCFPFSKMFGPHNRTGESSYFIGFMEFLFRQLCLDYIFSPKYTATGAICQEIDNVLIDTGTLTFFYVDVIFKVSKPFFYGFKAWHISMKLISFVFPIKINAYEENDHHKIWRALVLGHKHIPFAMLSVIVTTSVITQLIIRCILYSEQGAEIPSTAREFVFAAYWKMRRNNKRTRSVTYFCLYFLEN